MTINIMLLGAGGAAGRNFMKAVQLGAKKQRQNILWLLQDTDEWALKLCPPCDSMLFMTDMESAINSTYWFDVVHSQPEEGVRLLLESSGFLKKKVFENSVSEYFTYRDKLHCQRAWRDSLCIPFWLDNAEEVTKTNFYKKLSRQPDSKLWVRAQTGAGSKAALPVNHWKQLRGWISYWQSKDPTMKFILSDFLPGEEYAVQMFWIDGDLYMAQARERVGYLFGNQMPSGQSSTPSLSKACRSDRVYRTAIDAVLALVDQPHGIYGVDMKTTATGDIMPTEINYGRFYTTSHQFALYEPDPVNMPWAYIKYIAYGEIPEVQYNRLPDTMYFMRGLDSEGVVGW